MKIGDKIVFQILRKSYTGSKIKNIKVQKVSATVLKIFENQIAVMLPNGLEKLIWKRDIIQE
jgi:hypothetical protein